MRYYCSYCVRNFEDKLKKIWGLKKYNPKTDKKKPTVFFGIYLKEDYDTLRNHKGKKWAFWCGSDILGLLREKGYQKDIKNIENVEHWCENEVEAENLRKVGIEPNIGPSFLGQIEDYPLSYQYSEKPEVFSCMHAGGREDEYGLSLIKKISPLLPDYTFHIYGITGKDSKNIVFHGRVGEEQFNKEIRKYQSGLRMNKHDGFSEVIAKSVLLGQYPISRIAYPEVWYYEEKEDLIMQLEKLKLKKEPNKKGREYWLNKFNNFPWIK